MIHRPCVQNLNQCCLELNEQVRPFLCASSKHRPPRVSGFMRSSLPLQPMFLQETSDCSYLFEWRTQYACPPFDLIECSFK